MKAALITGSSNGLGLAIAEALAGAGCNLVLHGLAPEAEVAPTCARLRAAHGIKAAYVRSDLFSEAGVVALADAARAELGGIDILVNNAVVRHFGPVESLPLEAWQRALAVNLTAAFRLVQLALPGMRARGWGRIVNLTSVYGSRGAMNRADYVTTKTALIGLTRAVAMETVATGITCNAVCPGTVMTPGIDVRVKELMASAGLAREDAERRFLEGKQPTGRFVQAADVGALVAFLCGAAAQDITGAVLPMEGGWLAG